MRFLSVLFTLLATSVAVFSADAPIEAKPITVVVIYAELAAARDTQTLKIPAGTTLKKLLLESREFGAKKPLVWAQGFVELRRLPNMERGGLQTMLSAHDVKSTDKAQVALEDGDIVITDLWPDF